MAQGIQIDFRGNDEKATVCLELGDKEAGQHEIKLEKWRPEGADPTGPALF